jgi:hypothetical protein
MSEKLLRVQAEEEGDRGNAEMLKAGTLKTGRYGWINLKKRSPNGLETIAMRFVPSSVMLPA